MSITESEQILTRLSKREEIAKKQGTAYPVASLSAKRTPINQVRSTYSELQPNEQAEEMVIVTGRVMRVRHAGKISFIVIQEGNGDRIQGLFSRAVIGEESHAELKSIVDLGDFVALTGHPGASSTGELSIFVETWQVISKTVRPLPNQHSELNEETRARKRYLDFILNEESRNRMLMRSNVISSIRRLMEDEGFLEVETPMLQVQKGGAAARPFTTHSNALDSDLYLRIAPELFLKRAVVGGLEKVFEVNKNFRNEGMDSTHSPEFTMMEAYQAYADYQDMATLVEGLIKNAAGRAGGTEVDLHLDTPWERVSLYASLSQAVNQEITPQTTVDELLSLAETYGLTGVHGMKAPTHGKLVEELWEELALPSITSPTFVMDYPADSSPLVAPHRSVKGVAEKWDLYINGMEVATGYSELVDPVVQRQKLEAQALLAGAGDDEAMSIDEDFLEALEHGMPPTGGIGIGIDRLIMLLTNRGIRDTVLFPLVK